jgi:hypothetical protein
MKHKPRPPISNQRLARITTWVRLWLLRLAGFVIEHAGASAPPPRWLERMIEPMLAYLARTLALLIVVRALQRVDLPPTRGRRFPGRYRPMRASMERLLVGAPLRRALRGRDVRARIAALLHFMCDPEAAITAQAARLRRGVRFLRAIFFAECKTTPAPAGPRLRAAHADTS